MCFNFPLKVRKLFATHTVPSNTMEYLDGYCCRTKPLSVRNDTITAFDLN